MYAFILCDRIEEIYFAKFELIQFQTIARVFTINF